VSSLFPAGLRRYIGVLTGGGNYGWIEVERFDFQLVAYSWAYQTETGVPILAGQVPAPGAAAVLCLGAAHACRRRRDNDARG
jgi:hypothetical protein